MILRIARHTNNLKLLELFYRKVLGLELLGSFENHSNYNGIFLGKSNLNWHLEFTESDEIANHHFDDDDCIVFYPETTEEYNYLIASIKNNNINFVIPKNPYWKDNGKMILDPDGFRIVISHLRINNEYNHRNQAFNS